MKFCKDYEVVCGGEGIHSPHITKLKDIHSKYRHEDGRGLNVVLIPIVNGKPISDPIDIDACEFYGPVFTQSTHVRVEIDSQIDDGELEKAADSFGKVFSEDI